MSNRWGQFMVTLYLISDKEVCSHEKLKMPSDKHGSNTWSRLQWRRRYWSIFRATFQWYTHKLRHFITMKIIQYVFLFRVVQKDTTIMISSIIYTLQFTDFSVPHVQAISVLCDAICCPSKSQGLVMDKRCGSHRGGCLWRIALIGEI